MPIKLKLIKNQNAAYVASPKSQPTIVTAAISDLSGYSNTQSMLANDATTYANTINYVSNQNFVNSSQLSANLSVLTVSGLSDVVPTLLSNGSTLVYSTANNKYVVKQLDIDGGTF
jgi:hypothetical protein